MRSEWTLSGKEAVLRARQSIDMGDAFHAYIIDWRLPDMNGIEVTRQIRAMGDDTPIIILTAYDWSNIELEAKAAGVTAFCAKPMFMSDLRDTLMTAIGQQQTKNADPLLHRNDTLDFKGKRLLLVEDNELNREIALEITFWFLWIFRCPSRMAMKLPGVFGCWIIRNFLRFQLLL